MNRLGVYLHIPFCAGKCHYCDFLSFAGMEGRYEGYKNALIQEIRNATELAGADIDTIFIGGGTPSVLPPGFIAEILWAVKEYRVTGDAEVTVEANPGTVSLKALEEYVSAGVNRVSFGLQAVQNKHLQGIGRIHRFEDFVESYKAAKAAGVGSISVDLMFALPGQTVAELHESLEVLVKMEPQHISVYSLIVEEGTEFGRRSKEGKLAPVDDETDRQMYYMVNDFLKSAGYNRYEISNFAKPGFASRHNIKYWRMKNYLGLGLNAHSKIGKMRFENTSNLDEYLREAGNINALRKNKILTERADEMAEFMFLGLRTSHGVSKSEFLRMFGENIFGVYGAVLTKFINNGLLVQNKNRIFLSEWGIDLSNMVMAEFL